jgi:outer membrane protein OmpA-like peptidoglycan-associated protein
MNIYILTLFLSLMSLFLTAQCPNGLKTATHNLVKNGDFEAGFADFETDYDFVSARADGLIPEGTFAVEYSVGQLHYAFKDCGDHSTGKGRMVLVNGAVNPNSAIWKQTICVPSMSLLTFNGWFSNLVAQPPFIEIRLNGKMMIDSRDVYLSQCDWIDLGFQWYSNNDTTALLEIYNQNTEASDNDFAIDDISVFACFSAAQGELPCGKNPFYNTKKDTIFIDKEKNLEENEILILKNVQFEKSKFELDSLSKQELDKVAGWLLISPSMQIELSGHTSNEGDEQKNYTLSLNRVQACQNYILQKGIKENRVQIKAYGETKPAFNNENESEKKKNRRVELQILQK